MPTMFSRLRVVPSSDPARGGTPFTAYPPHPSFALVGLSLRVGDWIDQVTPIFAEVLEDGGFGPEQIGPSFGGLGGLPRELRVSPGFVVTGLQTRSGDFLDGVRLHQTPWDGRLLSGESSWTPWAHGVRGGGSEQAARHAEPHGQALLVGISGRSGWYVDALSIVSAEIYRMPASSLTGSRYSAAR